MSKFSTRHGYDLRDVGPPKVEEAPEWMRIAYINGVLQPLTFVDKDSRFSNDEGRPIGVKGLGEAFFVMLRQEPHDQLYDSFHCWDVLKSELKSTDWFHFYDFMELVATQLREAEEWQFDPTWSKTYGLSKHIEKVNSLLAENRVAWRLNSNCRLSREIPTVIGRVLNSVDQNMVDAFAPSRVHYRKSFAFIYDRPTDLENGIKEIASAVESCGKVIYPGCATLGDVIKAMRRDAKHLPTMISIIEKFNLLANSEPAIRHGGTKNSQILLPDAEFCFHVGVALVRYLMAKRGVGS